MFCEAGTAPALQTAPRAASSCRGTHATTQQALRACTRCVPPSRRAAVLCGACARVLNGARAWSRPRGGLPRLPANLFLLPAVPPPLQLRPLETHRQARNPHPSMSRPANIAPSPQREYPATCRARRAKSASCNMLRRTEEEKGGVRRAPNPRVRGVRNSAVPFSVAFEPQLEKCTVVTTRVQRGLARRPQRRACRGLVGPFLASTSRARRLRLPPAARQHDSWLSAGAREAVGLPRIPPADPARPRPCRAARPPTPTSSDRPNQPTPPRHQA
jgi:hypothetical protein